MLEYRTYLLVCLMEECAEIQKEAAKCLRFGESNWHPADPKITLNVDRLKYEIIDLCAIIEMLDFDPKFNGADYEITKKMDDKRRKVEYMYDKEVYLK